MSFRVLTGRGVGCTLAQCPVATLHFFHAGAVDKCTPHACSANFYACPDTHVLSAPLAEAAGSVTATFLDCTCECDDALGGFQTNDAGLCTEQMCRAEVRLHSTRVLSLSSCPFASRWSESTVSWCPYTAAGRPPG
jgi:hypothetical protein